MYYGNDIPWKDTMICGIVYAKPGEKISKSKNNATLSPQQLIEKCTADYIRYGTANVKLGADTYFDEQDVVDVSRRFINKLWNSCKFVLSHLHDYNINEQVELLPVDKWIIEKTNKTIKEAQGYLDNYEVALARKVIDEFFWGDFCDNYIEIVKDRLYKPEVHGAENRKSAQQASFYVLLNLLKMYSIYVPHLTEYLYIKGFKDFVGETSIHLTEWPKVENVDANMLKFGQILADIVAEARRYKTTNGLSMKAEMEQIVVKGPKEFEQMFKLTEKDLFACTNAQKIEYDLN
jgi:valyl-tRNA synthetase